MRVGVNEHRDLYQTVGEYVDELGDKDEIDNRTLEKMIETNTIVNIQFYPDTPIGFYNVYAGSLDEALQMAQECLEDNNN